MKLVMLEGNMMGGDNPYCTIAEAGANYNRELGTAKIEKPWW